MFRLNGRNLFSWRWSLLRVFRIVAETKETRSNKKKRRRQNVKKYQRLTVLTTSFKMAALSGLVEFMSRLLICRNSPSCSMYSFSCSRRRFSLLHLLIWDCGCAIVYMKRKTGKWIKNENNVILCKRNKTSKLCNSDESMDGWAATHTLLSDLRRIFLDAAGGHATLETTAFIIFAWDWMVGSCWWFCCCCCCDPCWWCDPNWFGVLPATGDRSAALIVWFGRWEACDSCVCEIHWSDSGISQGPSLENSERKNSEISFNVYLWTKMN